MRRTSCFSGHWALFFLSGVGVRVCRLLDFLMPVVRTPPTRRTGSFLRATARQVKLSSIFKGDFPHKVWGVWLLLELLFLGDGKARSFLADFCSSPSGQYMPNWFRFSNPSVLRVRNQGILGWPGHRFSMLGISCSWFARMSSFSGYMFMDVYVFLQHYFDQTSGGRRKLRRFSTFVHYPVSKLMALP